MSISHDKKFMRAAIAAARKGVMRGQTPFGACIVKKGKVISVAHNRVWATTDITAHAEIVAIRSACRKMKTVDLSGCVIYSTCEPCPMCFSACHWARIKRIVCGARIEDAKKIGFHELLISNDQLRKIGRLALIVEKDFLREENLALFDFWRQRTDSKAY